MFPSLHPLIAGWLERKGLHDAARSDGRATLIIDDKYRIHLCMAGDRVALSSRLCALPAAGVARDRLLVALGKQALGMLHRHDAGCVIDPREEALWLQQMVADARDDLALDEALGRFANALSFWTGAVRRAS